MNNTKLKVLIILVLVMLLVILIIAYFNETAINKENDYIEIDKEGTKLEVEYTEKELTGEWSDYTAKITLDDTKTVIEGKGVETDNNTITINSAGTYYITGNISDGNIVINANKNAEVQLVLDNASITSKSTAPINGVEADKLTITLLDNSVNTITDNSTYTKFTDTESQEPDGTIFTKTDLIINGNGKLIVNANYLDGIVSKDGLKIINSNIEINSEDDGIRGKDYVAINNANIEITSKGDGIKSTNSTDTEMGYIAIEGGNININAKNDGIQAETILNISSDAMINITTTGEITSSSNSSQNFGPGSKPGYSSSNSTNSENSISSKGLKAGTEITVDSGNIVISSTDDSIHSNGIIIINSGNIELSSGDDGIHADTNIVINDGDINITKSYEGIESAYIEINGGTINVTSSDDGINVAGGNDSSSVDGRNGQNNFSSVSSSNRKLVINNGNISVNANGDGLDSNGSIYISGGNVLVVGPTNSGNGALDYDGECVVTGGDIIIYGPNGMWQNPSNTSTQYSLTFQISGNVGDEIVVKDSSGVEITSFKAEKSYGCITISNSSIKNGETYTLYKNGSEEGSIKVNSIVSTYGSTSNNNNMIKQNKGNKGGF